MKFDGSPWKTIGHLFHASSSFMHHFIAIGEFQLELQSGNAQFGSKSTIFLALWPCNLTCDLENNRHLFYAISSFVHHFVAIGEFKLALQSGNTQSGSNSTIFRVCDLEICQMTLKNNRAPLLSNIKLYTSFHHHMWIQTGVTVRKRLSWVVTSVTLTFNLWPWPFAWTLLWSLVITPENFMMIWWWEYSEKGVTDGQMDRKYHSLSCLVAAKNLLKIYIIMIIVFWYFFNLWASKFKVKVKNKGQYFAFKLLTSEAVRQTNASRLANVRAF